MNRVILAAFLLTIGLAPCLCAEQAVGLSDNAALYYWRAMADSPWVHRYLEEHPDVDKDPINAALDDEIEKSLRRDTSFFRYIHAGAACRQCEWALLKAGPNTLLEHVQNSRDVARMLVLRARVHLADGNQLAGIEDFRLLMIYTRHVAADNMHISFLAGNAHQQQGVEILARELTNMSPAELKKLDAILDALPEAGTLQDRIAAEKELNLGWIRDAIDKGEAGQMQQELVSLAMESGSGDASEEKKQAAEKTADEIRQAFEKGNATVLEMVAKAEGQYETAAAVVARRDSEFSKDYDEFVKEFESADAVTRIMLAIRPKFLQFDQLRERDRQAKMRIRLLKAAIDVVLNGRDALEKHIDTESRKPYAYVQLGPQRFELSSTLLVDGKPYAISFGPQPKK